MLFRKRGLLRYAYRRKTVQNASGYCEFEFKSLNLCVYNVWCLLFNVSRARAEEGAALRARLLALKFSRYLFFRKANKRKRENRLWISYERSQMKTPN